LNERIRLLAVPVKILGYSEGVIKSESQDLKTLESSGEGIRHLLAFKEIFLRKFHF
jgi:hypothetical protein